MMLRCFSVVVLFCGSVACGHKTNPGGSCAAPLAPITYTAQVQTLMSNYCISCHSASASNRQGAPTDVNLDSYQGVLDNADMVDEDILSGRMPMNNEGQSQQLLTQDERCLFDGWFTGGRLQ